ncbi:MAG: hypothetical protein QXY37_00155 [Metallosphaera sp.]
MKNLIIKLTDEEFKKIEEEAREKGFVLISEYVKYKLFGQSVRNTNESSINEAFNPITVELLNVKKKLGELAERVDSIELTISKEAANVNKNVHEQESRRERKDERRPIQEPKRSAIDYLKEQGVMYESKLTSLKNPDAFFEKLESQGAKIIYAAEERIAFDPSFYQSFVSKLAQIPTSDEKEAQRYLSNQEYELFQRLRKAGGIYFDSKDKHWKMA